MIPRELISRKSLIQCIQRLKGVFLFPFQKTIFIQKHPKGCWGAELFGWILQVSIATKGTP